MATTSFRVALVIKGTRAEAEEELTKRLNEWFASDLRGKVPFEPGALLWWGIKDDETKELL